MFDEYSVRGPFTVSSWAVKDACFRNRTQPPSSYLSWSQLSRSRVVGLIGLAIAVALCGLGYKLSSYRRHPGPSSQASIAKMWIERRSAFGVAASTLNTRLHLISASQALPVPIQQSPHQSRAAVCIFPASTRDVAYFESLIPSRSPPADSCYLV